MVREITVQQLKAMMDNSDDFQLIDVREPHEYQVANLGGELIPLGTLPEHVDEIKKDGMVVIQCRSGARSGRAVDFLQASYGYSNLFNLKGGILAWAAEIDPSMQVS